MTEQIPEIIAQIERENNIKIIFAVESGSRVWGMDSPDSDYDIRGIFMSQDPVTRNSVFLSSGKSVTIDGFTPDRKYDWVFWDITTFLRFLKNNNPTAIDWMISNICYVGEEELRAVRELFLKNCDINYYLIHHYGLMKSMYEKFVNPLRRSKRSLDNRDFLQGIENIHQHLDTLEASHPEKSGNLLDTITRNLADMRGILEREYSPVEEENETRIKKILYACRSAICIDYILQNGDFPPLDVTKGFREITVDFDRDNFAELLATKRRTKELEPCMCPEWMTAWYIKLSAIMRKKCIEIKKNKKIDVPNDVYTQYYIDCVQKK
jgi:predicted nucleotidyltransferase